MYSVLFNLAQYIVLVLLIDTNEALFCFLELFLRIIHIAAQRSSCGNPSISRYVDRLLFFVIILNDPNKIYGQYNNVIGRGSI